MILKTRLLGKTYEFRDLKDVLAKANEEKTGDRLAGLAAETALLRPSAAGECMAKAKTSRSPAAMLR